MEDIFSREQTILDDAQAHINEVRNGSFLSLDKFVNLTNEYKVLLKQHRKIIKISDRASTNLIIDQRGQITDLKDKVHYDGLTGIFNRRYLEENLKRVIKSVSRSGGHLSVLMLDIDYFKRYNDTYGHNEGDICLIAVAKTISECLLRADDFVARYGGEEFTVVLPDTDEAGARLISNKVLENIRALNIPHEKNEAASCVTISIGATTSKVEYTQTSEDYLKNADKALYQSKQNGRNQYTYIDFR